MLAPWIRSAINLHRSGALIKSQQYWTKQKDNVRLSTDRLKVTRAKKLQYKTLPFKQHFQKASTAKPIGPTVEAPNEPLSKIRAAISAANAITKSREKHKITTDEIRAMLDSAKSELDKATITMDPPRSWLDKISSGIGEFIVCYIMAWIILLGCCIVIGLIMSLFVKD
jgi:hypothetical protein